MKSELDILYPYDQSKPITQEDAFVFCENLAKTHYENFTVVSLFIPKIHRQHLYNLYAFCRYSDDIGDEVKDLNLSLQLFNLWRNELHQCYQGTPQHPVFIALQQTIQAHDLPIEPFQKLIKAFEMDQTITRFPNFEKLLYYCEHSANPVGRLFLNIFGYRNEERYQLSDHTCTALQLANFWQDVSVDYQKGRIYIPQEDMRNFGYSESELALGVYNDAFIKLMQFEVDRAWEFFQKGLKLIHHIDGRLKLDVECFSRGGMKILERIRHMKYNVLKDRPALTKWDKIQILYLAFFRQLLKTNG